ncbi:MAG: DUF1847 domain-containing protein [Lachnospiraceae bacterium]|nr:DUF1847 domain-containing protein [Lachnospiraceae bacterium]
MAGEKDFGRSCIDCGTMGCAFGGPFPKFCLTTNKDENPIEKEALEEALATYDNNPEDKKIMQMAALVEYENYGVFTRVQEIIDFCRRMGFKKVGIATCIGLIKEAQIAARIFRNAGLEVFGQSCKAGMIPKSRFDIPEKCNAVGADICNPIFQAKHINKLGTELNVIVGLCVGHDSLFYKYSEALCTTLITKDRVTGHNPAAALYTEYSYYKKKFMQQAASEPKND